ncbi:hypothetical protein Tco_1287252 [Tanacetum coccineum]
MGHGGCGRDGGVVVETAVMMLLVSMVAGDGDGDGDVDGAVGEADEVMRMMIWWLAEKSVVAGIISGGGAGSGERRGR